ncbi:MAG: HAD-IA family hydrolase [Candidatus Omnitrophica bacterium]|nr:HAD-IA family hydrolase [Candidatus Omnitrophota bacterium]
MIKGIIFDFDGVIVESTDIKTEAFAKLFEIEGERVVEKVVSYHKDNMGVSRFDKFRYIYRNILHRQLDDKEFNSLCTRFASLVLDAVVKAPYVKGVQEFLINRSKQSKLFIVSATPQDEISDIVRRRGLDKIFISVYGAPLAKFDAVKKILMDNKISAQGALYIGDAMSDYLAAKDNGVKFIARIKNNENIFKASDCLKMNDFSELPAILDTL